jgi:hypothetical protein
VRHPLGGAIASFHWCLHCERAYSSKAWNLNGWHCPGHECSGDLLDAIPWTPTNWPCSENPDYPDVPVVGEVYRLYAGNVLDPKKIKEGVRRIARSLLLGR